MAKKEKQFKYGKHKLFRRTIPYLRQNIIKISICIIFAIAISVLTAYMPTITKQILDDYIKPSKTIEDINKIGVYKLLFTYLGYTVIVVILRYSLNFLLNLTGMNIERSIREDAIRKIDYLPVDYFALEPDGKIVAKITSDSSGVRTFFTVTFNICQAIANQEEYMLNDYKDLVNRYNSMQTKANSINAYLGIELLEVIKRLLIACILLFFGFRYFENEAYVTVGIITLFNEYLDKMVGPINTIFNNLNELEDSVVAANRVYMFLDEENDVRIFDGAALDKEIIGNIEFNNVHFSYVESKEVLHGINLSIKAGESIGIVGHTGSGKSSLMNLLLQFNDYQSGEILVDGVDISTYNKASYRKQCGIVLQTPALFAGTLKDNVTLERNYSDEEVIKVLNEVGASYIIDKDPKGIYQQISFRGENLSLGEKQLISFARILLRNPKILVLDEATANIDTETELKIKNAMDVVSKGRTTFIIAHRLSTIKNCDRIIVLDHGLIKGDDNHDNLYKNCSIYKDMYDSQYKTILEHELLNS